MDAERLSSTVFRYGPIVEFTVFVLVTLLLRWVVFVRRNRSNPMAFGRRASSEGVGPYVERWMLAAFLLVGLALGFRAASPAIPVELGPWRALQAPASFWSGLVLTTIAVLWTFLAQGSMGASWRVGIPDEETPALVTGGFFRYGRNPIYLGVFIGMTGQFLLVPSAALALLWIFSAILIGVQVRCEEEFLVAAHGEAYLEYARRVGRYLPWFGRLRGTP